MGKTADKQNNSKPSHKSMCLKEAKSGYTPKEGSFKKPQQDLTGTGILIGPQNRLFMVSQ